ncbi:MAG TPA: hypothetical protein VFX59_14790 [Polyangiales bacterium]|nr:hypothetical protein [Polyangiales bacterium]
MSLYPHLLVQRARVGSSALRHQDVRQLDGEPALALALALAPPRLWGYLLDATLDGFAEGFARPHDGKVSTRIHQGLRVAQNTLRARIDGLLDRRGADVALLALAREGDVLHLLVAGGLRAYVFRQRSLRRLGTYDATDEGLLKAEPIWCAEPVEPGDLVFAGASPLFTEQALTRVREACLADRQLDPGKVASLLNSDESVVRGDAVIAFRVS